MGIELSAFAGADEVDEFLGHKPDEREDMARPLHRFVIPKKRAVDANAYARAHMPANRQLPRTLHDMGESGSGERSEDRVGASNSENANYIDGSLEASGGVERTARPSGNAVVCVLRYEGSVRRWAISEPRRSVLLASLSKLRRYYFVVREC